MSRKLAFDLQLIRKAILEISIESGEGHIPSAFSILEIVSVLYSSILNVEEICKGSTERDRFILSKGHGCLALYFILGEVGLIRRSDLASFCSFDGLLGGHPKRSIVHGIEASTGSLGHGLAIAVGLATSLKRRSSRARVYSLIGDGECNEGSVWEAALLASHNKLTNLMCIVDYNHSGDRALLLGDLGKKFDSFGFTVIDVDGHDINKLEIALSHVDQTNPVAVIAHTIKGRGLKMMENNPAWHHASPNLEQLRDFLTELSGNA